MRSAIRAAMTMMVRAGFALPLRRKRAAAGGVANEWHLVHLGPGRRWLVFCDSTAVQAQGRRTHGDLGIWSDSQIEPLARVARFLKEEGAVAGIQLAHAGRKASE